MSMINYASREINCKLVYYGPGLGGKTTNLEHIYGKVSPNTRGKMISLATETERTLFFLLARRPRHDPRLQDALPPLHRPRAGLLQRQPQADPQGRGWNRVRRRQPDRARGSERRIHAKPVRQHVGVRLRRDQDPVRHPVQQARPAQRRPGARASGGPEPGLADRGARPPEGDPRPGPRRP